MTETETYEVAEADVVRVIADLSTMSGAQRIMSAPCGRGYVVTVDWLVA